MLLAILALLIALWCPAAAIKSEAVESRQSCAVTQARPYSIMCDRRGWVQVPSTLQVLSEVSKSDCATTCFGNTTCKSFRYLAANRKCVLYKKHLAAMDFTSSNYEAGLFWDRDCYTTDCNLIKTCRATKDCKNTGGAGQSYSVKFYSQFGCGYGVTAKFDVPGKIVKVIPQGDPVCSVVDSCAKEKPSGPFVVSFHIPSQTWICTTYGRTREYFYYTSEDVSAQTLTEKNSSIGASYGYWVTGGQSIYTPPMDT